MESSDTVYAQSDLKIEEIMKLNPDVILYNAGNSSHAEILKASGIPSIGFATVGAVSYTHLVSPSKVKIARLLVKPQK